MEGLAEGGCGRAVVEGGGQTGRSGEVVLVMIEHKANTAPVREATMPDFPRSLVEFQSSFPDEGACVAYLFAARWPHSFVCPACGSHKAWRLQTSAWTWECAGCGKQTSVTAGTIMHHSKLPLTTWF